MIKKGLFCKNFQFLAHTWYPSRCYEATGQKPELTGVIKLGFMNKYEDGREDCLASCRIYGMTACEWDVDDGECWAHTKEVVFGETSRVTFCYRFNQDKPVAGIWFSSEGIKFCAFHTFYRLCSFKIWVDFVFTKTAFQGQLCSIFIRVCSLL